MKKTIASLVFLQVGSVLAVAAPVTDISVRQRWPWSPKVDIIFSVGEGEKSDIELSATWDERTEPLALTAANGLAGRSFGLVGEQGHMVWDPRAAGITNALTGFKVSAKSVVAASRTWLVIDLVSGAHQYFAAPPDGDWTADVYKESKMVFRRVEGRSFTMGYTADQRAACKAAGGPTDWHVNFWKDHQVILNDDYYLAVYRVTRLQASYLSKGKAYDDDGTYHNWCTGYGWSRADYRGNTNEVNRARWPDDGYHVTPESLFGRFRALTGNIFTIDLPTEAQWENAARNGTDTLWDVGGDASTITTEAFNAYVSRFVNFETTEVGLKEASTLGFYDLYGRALELCLDIWRKTLPATETDPIGPTFAETGSSSFVARGMGANVSNTKCGYCVPAQRINYEGGKEGDYTSAAYGNYVVRPCIHLNSLFD